MKLIIFALLSMAILSFAQDDSTYCLDTFCAPKNCTGKYEAECETFVNQENGCFEDLVWGDWADFNTSCVANNTAFYKPILMCSQNICNGVVGGVGYCMMWNHIDVVTKCQGEDACGKYLHCVSYHCNVTDTSCRQDCITNNTATTKAIESAFKLCFEESEESDS